MKAAQLAGRYIDRDEEKTFRDEDEALQYAIHNQRNRQNMTEADLLQCIEAVDQRRDQKKVIESQGRDASWKFKPLGPIGPNGNSAATTARIVGTSERKVKRARQVLSDPKEKEVVRAGKKTIHQASQDVKKKRTRNRHGLRKFSLQEERSREQQGYFYI